MSRDIGVRDAAKSSLLCGYMPMYSKDTMKTSDHAGYWENASGPKMAAKRVVLGNVSAKWWGIGLRLASDLEVIGLRNSTE